MELPTTPVVPNHPAAHPTLTRLRSGRAKISGTESTPDEITIHYLHAGPISPPSIAGPSPSTAIAPRATILLIHGFPETSYQFRHVLSPLAARGFRVIAPDYRGAGASSKPNSPGTIPYTKTAMATDLHTLLHEHLKITEPVHVVGHDIGGMVAHAYAAKFPEDTASVAWGECPLPGTQAYEETKHDPKLWHFTFHWQPDLPEQLVQGRERTYLRHFYDRLCYNAGFLSIKDLDVYESAFSQPGAMRAGFETYRAFHRDAEENKEMLREKGKCKVRAMALNGEKSMLAGLAESMFTEMYEEGGWEVALVEGSGHWCAEENPGGFVEEVAGWVGRNLR